MSKTTETVDDLATKGRWPSFIKLFAVILAAAGVSIGTKLDDVKKLSWKIVLVSLLVFCGTFFGSAIIAHVMLSIQGLI